MIREHVEEMADACGFSTPEKYKGIYPDWSQEEPPGVALIHVSGKIQAVKYYPLVISNDPENETIIKARSNDEMIEKIDLLARGCKLRLKGTLKEKCLKHDGKFLESMGDNGKCSLMQRSGRDSSSSSSPWNIAKRTIIRFDVTFDTNRGSETTRTPEQFFAHVKKYKSFHDTGKWEIIETDRETFKEWYVANDVDKNILFPGDDDDMEIKRNYVKMMSMFHEGLDNKNKFMITFYKGNSDDSIPFADITSLDKARENIRKITAGSVPVNLASRLRPIRDAVKKDDWQDKRRKEAWEKIGDLINSLDGEKYPREMELLKKSRSILSKTDPNKPYKKSLNNVDPDAIRKIFLPDRRIDDAKIKWQEASKYLDEYEGYDIKKIVNNLESEKKKVKKEIQQGKKLEKTPAVEELLDVLEYKKGRINKDIDEWKDHDKKWMPLAREIARDSLTRLLERKDYSVLSLDEDRWSR
jgi:hypothetical protein